ncbi:glycosyltransferase involved in cell wall biosynthesis [Algoriphagus aquaeductus]|uniref:Glycosyltransferase involved in cell wall biosynthesis n=1 Tax=Algoriphagus aquaeductus TaxID=475299 RepID=A0A326RMQ3_9BACT|nr:glycosyltransferase [Algoriphagus aquaeductus]PZV79129.1 glycosyltransferase involved in cell wall biosynthesis [Algoriphagus aquaeductus]
MRFLIISHVVHKINGCQVFAYGPYVKEINLWIKQVDEVVILAPQKSDLLPNPIDLAYIHPNIKIVQAPEIDALTWLSRLKLIWNLPKIFFELFIQMAKADHIHLRCPGNMGLLGCLTQIFFSKKAKTAKYAGNWDPSSPQPLTYRWQRNILSNQFLTKNMKVLVYGDWGIGNKNLLSFFTASYTVNEIEETPLRTLDFPLIFIFVGSLHHGKNPMLSCLATAELVAKRIDCQLHLYGEGPERISIQNFIDQRDLKANIFLHGNVEGPILKKAYKASHFLLFASDSEGWPKAVAEAMFWGCVPITTSVSCVPQMLGNGERGELIDKDPVLMASTIEALLNNPTIYFQKASNAMKWSREFTIEKFEREIQKLLKE